MNLATQYKQFAHVARFERAYKHSDRIKRPVLEDYAYMRSNHSQWMLFPEFSAQ